LQAPARPGARIELDAIGWFATGRWIAVWRVIILLLFPVIALAVFIPKVLRVGFA